MSENIITYVDYHISHIGTKHQSYLQDTPDFFRNIQRINEGPELDDKCILFTLDVIGLYTNIIHEEGLPSLENELEKKSDKRVPTQFIMKLMEILLKNNIFEFHDGHFQQNIGATMDCKPIPKYANSYIATIELIKK